MSLVTSDNIGRVVSSSVVRNIIRISKNEFVSVLCSKSNPTVCRERDAGDYYDAITVYKIDPLFILAMFNHESNMGRYGSAAYTRSWGNTRPPSIVVESSGVTSRGFNTYDTWLDGCVSTVARLHSYYRYDGLNTISEIINTWAPASDNNNVAVYVKSVVDFMNTFKDMERVVMTFTIGEGVKNAMAARGDQPMGHEIWHPANADPNAQYYSMTPSMQGMYITHKLFNDKLEVIGFQVHFLPK